MKNNKKLIALLLCLVLALAGCASPSAAPAEPTKPTTPTEPTTPEKTPKEFTLVYAAEMSTFNYLMISGSPEIAVLTCLVDPLVEFDSKGTTKPCMAESWKVTDDGLVWEFKIREGAKWYDIKGNEYADVTAQDFVDGMKYILTSEHASETAGLLFSIIKNSQEYYNKEITDFAEVGVKAIDKYTLQYTLINPSPYFLKMTSYLCFFPVNGKFLEEQGEEFGIDKDNILFSGPYIVESFEPQYKRVLALNKNYWNIGNMYIDKINYIYNKEASALGPEMFLRGEISEADIPPTAIEQWQKDPELKNKIRPRHDSAWTVFLGFNFEPNYETPELTNNWLKAVNNLNFRKSIFHGLNRVSAISTLEPTNPQAKLINTITPKNIISFEGKDYTQFGGLAKLVDVETFDKDLALKHRDKAMEELKGKVDFPIQVIMPYNSELIDWTNRAQIIEQQLENLLGSDYVDIVIPPYPSTDFKKKTRATGAFGLQELGWGPDYADPETYADPFTAYITMYNRVQLAKEYIDSDGISQYTKLITIAKSEGIDIAKRYEAFADAEAFLIDNALVIPFSRGSGGGVNRGGYVASLLNPFEGTGYQFGPSTTEYKGKHLLDKPMSEEEFNAAKEAWQKSN